MYIKEGMHDDDDDDDDDNNNNNKIRNVMRSVHLDELAMMIDVLTSLRRAY